VSEEQRENTETFGERHTDDGLNEDLTGRAGIATNGFGGFLSDQTDAESGTEKTESAGDIAGDFSEEDVHIFMDGCGCGCRRAHAKHAPDEKFLVMRLGGVGVAMVVIVFVIVTVIADEANVNRRQQRKHKGLNKTHEQFHEIENEKETRAVKQVFTAKYIAKKSNRKGKRPDTD